MTALRGSATGTLTARLRRSLWMIADGSEEPSEFHACLIEGERAPRGYGLYFRRSSDPRESMGTLRLPAELDHLGPGDLINIAPDGRQIRVVWRTKARQNSILLTERCDNYCLMCSQPPRDVDDSALLGLATDVIEMVPVDTQQVLYTGGEPTLYGDGLLDLLSLTLRRLPDAQVHLLSNGRRFADDEFARAYAAIGDERLMVGIPLYGAEASVHDFVVQARGAFDETVRGILNLVALGQPVEVRVVVHQQTVPELVAIAEFIARNLPFVHQVALMGLEIMGLARANLSDVWIDPWDYREELAEAALLLESARVRTFIFNHQLCLLDPAVWHLAVPSISDWKNVYQPVCSECAVKDDCGGFFQSSAYRSSTHIRAIQPEERASPALRVNGIPLTLRRSSAD